jgi:CRP-like cAMP-binding protein
MSSIDRTAAQRFSKTFVPVTLPPLMQSAVLRHGPRTRSLHVAKGTDVLVAGNRYDSWYVNHNGWLMRYKVLHSGSRQILDFILPGETFGLQACVFKSSLYSVVTITPASLTAVPLEMIDTMLDQGLHLSKALLWSAICESARLGEHVIDSSRRSAYERLSHFFLELFVRLKNVGLTVGMSFESPLTQELIADALGLTAIHVNRTLRCLRQDKLVAMDGKKVTILDFEALSLLSDFENSYLGEDARALCSR